MVSHSPITQEVAIVMGNGRTSVKKKGVDGGAKKVKRAPEPESIPRELAGRWIAWSSDGLRIIGSGTTFQEAIEAANAAGDPDAIFEVAPGPYLR